MSAPRSRKTSGASAAEAEDQVHVRMADSVTVPVGQGLQRYVRGETYLVPRSQGEAWMKEDLAVDPAKPPTCPHCREVAESQALLARHIAANHPKPVAPAPAGPPAGSVQCPECHLWAESQELLDRHVTANHPAEPKE